MKHKPRVSHGKDKNHCALPKTMPLTAFKSDRIPLDVRDSNVYWINISTVSESTRRVLTHTFWHFLQQYLTFQQPLQTFIWWHRFIVEHRQCPWLHTSQGCGVIIGSTFSIDGRIRRWTSGRNHILLDRRRQKSTTSLTGRVGSLRSNCSRFALHWS